ncbi:hypothetical protein VB620_06300 [Nodularia harveyana UHCC-0300]|uniref:SPOR domain-containing protein n=1 Tax=Nodularia harveyana UHCC-0300 TaxID=2974287 RepID=A0ABU5UCV2_9CYAN|nr:hypothetical protein [Nodularia harveyana]MEA5580950.1 hypothetical protein [Nodularia harveyana UHCC-0300]
MNQNSLVNSTTKSSKSGLKPGLAAALASLELPIDQELARYRRTRLGVKIQNQSLMENYVGSQTVDLPEHKPTEVENTTNTQTQAGFIFNETPKDNPAPTQETVEDLNLASESVHTEIPQSATNFTSSIVPAIRDEENLTPSEDTLAPDDYLESSEALLRSLTDEEESTPQPSNSYDSLLSPLGLGSMLLLLVASLTLGYVVFNPNAEGWSQFNVGRLFSRESSPTAIDDTPSETETKLTPIAKYPNLAAKEFPEVRNPSDIVGLQPKSQPTPSPVITQPPVQLLPQLQPVPVDVAPSSTAESMVEEGRNPVNTNGEILPSADGFYYVVMDNRGDRALSDAQKIVPDAYLSPGETLIYLAAVKTPEAAEARVKELNSQGLKARIQQP